jgi:hypothetical protein
MTIFKSIWPKSSQIKALLCVIFTSRELQDILCSRKISKNKYGGRQQIKFENPWLKGLRSENELKKILFLLFQVCHAFIVKEFKAR